MTAVDTKRVGIVGNPIAGRGAARGVVALVAARLEKRGHAVSVAWTEGAGDARRLAREIGPEVDCLIAAGGDGTLREVYAGAGDAAPLVPLALGTANMMARELGVPSDPDGLVALVESGTERRIDVGHVVETPFLAVLGVGFDGLVTRVIASQRRGALGYRGYVLPILRAALRYRRPHLQVALDDGPAEACGFAVVSKIRRYAGIMRISERARVDSGCFEVCLIEPAHAAHLMVVGPYALAGRLDRAPGVTLASARRVRVGCPDAAPVEVDGDYFGVTPVEATIEAGAARVLVPAASLGPG